MYIYNNNKIIYIKFKLIILKIIKCISLACNNKYNKNIYNKRKNLEESFTNTTAPLLNFLNLSVCVKRTFEYRLAKDLQRSWKHRDRNFWMDERT